MLILTPAQQVARALKRVDKALHQWQDDPDSPRHDVDKMIAIVNDLRDWVQGHVLADLERAEARIKSQSDSPPPPPPPDSTP